MKISRQNTVLLQKYENHSPEKSSHGRYWCTTLSTSQQGRGGCLTGSIPQYSSEIGLCVWVCSPLQNFRRQKDQISISRLTSSIPKNHCKNWMNTFDIFFSSAWLHLRNCTGMVPLSWIQWQDRLQEIVIKFLFSVKKEFQLLWKAILTSRRKTSQFSIMWLINAS